MNFEVECLGRPVTNRLGKVAVTIGVLAVAAVTLPVAVPLDIVLRRVGRKGFFRNTPSSWSWRMELGAFSRK